MAQQFISAWICVFGKKVAGISLNSIEWRALVSTRISKFNHWFNDAVSGRTCSRIAFIVYFRWLRCLVCFGMERHFDRMREVIRCIWSLPKQNSAFRPVVRLAILSTKSRNQSAIVFTRKTISQLIEVNQIEFPSKQFSVRSTRRSDQCIGR